MAYYAKDVIKIAEAEVGYLEKASNSNLDSKTGNAGSANYTKYARDLDAITFFNGKKNGYAWCSTFVSWCFYKAFGRAQAFRLLCQPTKDSLGAGTQFAALYYRTQNKFYTANPKVGDQIFFKDGENSIAHTGLVYKVDSKKVYTIEGNTSSASGVVANGGGVFKKSYDLTYSRIAGYGRPAYDVEIKKTSLELPILRKGDTGNAVKALQRILKIREWYKGSIDGKFGAQTETAVKAFQKFKGSKTADGIVGNWTWKQLIEG